MAPVITDGIDCPVWATGQWIATLLTFGLAALVLAWVAAPCRREHIVWPALALISGTLTCLMEPMFDHLYGLWFCEKGQWNLYTTFGSHQPIWVPAAYLTFHGGATVLISRVLARRPTMRTVWTVYAFIFVMALAMAFAAGLFGSGIICLSVRHSVDNPPIPWVHLAAVTVVAGIASTVGLLGRLLVAGTHAIGPEAVDNA
jgi:hypothetical protein